MDRKTTIKDVPNDFWVSTMPGKAIVKAVPRETATRISEFRSDTSGKKLNKTKVGSATDTLQALYSAKIGALATGLNKYVPNPYKDRNDLPTEFQHLAEKDEVLLQHILEIKWQKPRDFFNNRPPSQDDVKNPENLTYFHKFRYPFGDDATILDERNMEDEIAYHICTATKYVANSESDLRAHKFPKAKFYIALENESAQMKYTKSRLIDTTLARLANDNFDELLQKKFVKTLELSKGVVTPEQAYNLLRDYISHEGSKQTQNIKQFNRLYDLLNTPEGKEELEARFLLQDLVDHWIVRTSKGTYTWVKKNLEIGQRKEDAVQFLLNPNKEPEVEELEKELKAKKGAFA